MQKFNLQKEIYVYRGTATDEKEVAQHWSKMENNKTAYTTIKPGVYYIERDIAIPDEYKKFIDPYQRGKYYFLTLDKKPLFSFETLDLILDFSQLKLLYDNEEYENWFKEKEKEVYKEATPEKLGYLWKDDNTLCKYAYGFLFIIQLVDGKWTGYLDVPEMAKTTIPFTKNQIDFIVGAHRQLQNEIDWLNKRIEVYEE